MVGYVRTDTTNKIANGEVVDASFLDAEFDGVQAAFHAATGHVHDGTTANGAPITKVGPAQDVVVSGTAVLPKTDNTLDLGSATFEFKDLWIDGTANIDSLAADAGTVGGAAITTASNTQTLTGKTFDLTNNTLIATSAQLLTAVTDEAGTGSLVFSVSPTFTGTPTAPTAAVGTNTTQLATTAHVFAERSSTATLTNKTLNGVTIGTGALNVTATSSTFNNSVTLGGSVTDFTGTVVTFNHGNKGGTRTSLEVPTRPQAALGDGQWLRQTAAATTTFTLPASGTWAYFYILTNASTNVFISMEASVAAGGTAVLVVPAGQTLNALSWRIS